jgi:hypothetical protein
MLCPFANKRRSQSSHYRGAIACSIAQQITSYSKKEWYKMKRLPWNSNPDVSSVLVPETEEEREELLGVLDAQGVTHRRCFTTGGINGTLSFTGSPQWMSDGAVQLAFLSADGQVRPIWFWIVEIHDTSPRPVIWCCTEQDRNSAWPWP